MSLREDVIEMKKEVQEVKDASNNDISFAWSILSDYKKTNKRMFAIWIITFVAFVSLLCYTIYLLNDIGVSESTIEVEDVESIDNTHIKIGDDIWEKSK